MSDRRRQLPDADAVSDRWRPAPEIDTNIAEADIGAIKVGQDGQIQCNDAFGERESGRGRYGRFVQSERAAEMSSSYNVVVGFDNDSGLLPSG